MIDFYADNAPISSDPFFGLNGIILRLNILPELCGKWGRILPERKANDFNNEWDE